MIVNVQFKTYRSPEFLTAFNKFHHTEEDGQLFKKTRALNSIHKPDKTRVFIYTAPLVFVVVSSILDRFLFQEALTRGRSQDGGRDWIMNNSGATSLEEDQKGSSACA